MECLACKTEMKYLKEYRFDSQDNKRGFFSTIFDVEEHLIFDVYICPNCRRAEFIYKGTHEWLDM